jgi:regulator of nucleoside diphosphate kinase
MTTPTILLTEKDFLRLQSTIDSQGAKNFEDLELELDRAKIIPTTEAPADLVTMNTTFRYKNLSDDSEQTITIFYPTDANTEDSWTFPDRKTKTLEVVEVLSQP